MNTVQNEPLVTVGIVGALVSAAIVLAQSFGVPITDDQSNALNGFVAVAAPLIIALIGRQFVTPASTAVPRGTAKQIAQESADVGQPDPLGKL